MSRFPSSSASFWFSLAAELQTDDSADRRRIESEIAEIDQRIERQLTAIENGVDPTVVGERIRKLKEERKHAQAALAETETDLHDQDGISQNFEQACETLNDLPDLREAFAKADPKTRRAVYEAFRLSVGIDRNAGQIRMKALVSSAFRNVRDLEGLTGLVANGGIAGAGFEPATFGL